MEPLPRQTVLVVGLGKSGLSACRFLRQRGCQVRATDESRTPALDAVATTLAACGIAVELGGHTEAFCQGSRYVVVSPGVPPTALPLQWAAREQIPVLSELELGARFCRGRIVAVSGSNGKSTVTAWVGMMLELAERPVVVAGNIGWPLTGQLARIHPRTTVVVEVSSFQLEHVARFHPSVACLLNVTPNHLDRHSDFAAYVAAKRRFLTQQRTMDWAILNADDPVCQELRSSVKGRLLEWSRHRPVRGAYVAGDELVLMLRARRYQIARVDQLQVPGAHNVSNALAAIALGGVLGVEPETLGRAVRQFSGLPHRLERVATWHDVTFVNDSKSTTVEAGLRALEACPGHAVLIAGGRDKGSDFSKLVDTARQRVRAAVLIGTDGPRIARVLAPEIPTVLAQTMAEAVQTAARLARPGDWVLLSPMCTSFDWFRDFEERGQAFTQAVDALVSLERKPVATGPRPLGGLRRHDAVGTIFHREELGLSPESESPHPRAFTDDQAV